MLRLAFRSFGYAELRSMRMFFAESVALDEAMMAIGAVPRA